MLVNFLKIALRQLKPNARVNGLPSKLVGKTPTAAENFEGKSYIVIITAILITYDKESITPTNCFQRFEISKNSL